MVSQREALREQNNFNDDSQTVTHKRIYERNQSNTSQRLNWTVNEQIVYCCSFQLLVNLWNEGISIGWLILEGWRQHSLSLVPSGQSMNPGLNHDQSILSMLVSSVSFQVLSRGHSLLDQVVKVFRNRRSQTFGPHDSQDFVSSQPGNISNSMPISKEDTDLWGSLSLSRHLDNHVNYFFRSDLEPVGDASSVGNCRSRHTLPVQLNKQGTLDVCNHQETHIEPVWEQNESFEPLHDFS